MDIAETKKTEIDVGKLVSIQWLTKNQPLLYLIPHFPRKFCIIYNHTWEIGNDMIQLK